MGKMLEIAYFIKYILLFVVTIDNNNFYFFLDKLPDTFTKVEVVKEVRVDDYAKGVFSLQFNFDSTLLAVGFNAGGIKVIIIL